MCAADLQATLRRGRDFGEACGGHPCLQAATARRRIMICTTCYQGLVSQVHAWARTEG